MQMRPLDEGEVGTVDTVREMCRLINEGSRDPEVNRAALAIVHAYRVPQFDFEGERRAIYDWKRRNIRFFRDIEGKETLRSPRETLAVRGGDCDCQTILTLALLKTIGQLVRIVTISTHPEAPDVFSHVYPEVRDERGRWISLDTARKQPAYGRGPNHWYRRRVWDTDDGTWQDADQPVPQQLSSRAAFAGLGYYGGNPRNHLAANFVNVRQAAQLARSAGRRARARRGGIGDFNWNSLVSAVPSIEVGTSDIIAASRANPINLAPTTNPAQTVAASQLTPAAQAMLYGNTGITGSTLLVIGGVGLLALLLLRGRS